MPVPTFAQRAMNSALVATVYERLWRPVSFYLASGVTTGAEQRRAAEALRLSGAPGCSMSPAAQAISPGSWRSDYLPAALPSGWTSPSRC